MENIGEKIYKLRAEKGVSQERLAHELGVARFTVSRWERDAVQPTTENIKSLCAFFGVESTYFFGSVEESATAQDNTVGQTAVTEQAPKEPKFKGLKIVAMTVGIVLLALMLIACGIASYVIISPGAGGKWGTDIHIVNYEGIIFLVVGAVLVAVLIALSVFLVIRFAKNRKNRQ